MSTPLSKCPQNGHGFRKRKSEQAPQKSGQVFLRGNGDVG